MADELLDLVNDNDEIIGEVWKSEANQNPKLIHREIGVIVYDDKNRVLIQKRSHLKKVFPGLWTVTAAGHVGKGEDLLIAAHRELSEELGFDTKLKFFGKNLFRIPNETHITHWFIGPFPKNAKIILQKEEVDDTMFISPEELKRFGTENEDQKELRMGSDSKGAIENFWKIYS